MKKYYLFVLMALAIAGVAIVASPAAHAVDIYQACSGAAESEVCASSGDNVNGFIKNIVNALLFIIGALAVVMIIVGAIRYVASAGNSSQTSAAKNTILYAVVGLLLAVFAFAIVNFVLTRLNIQ